MDKLQEALEWIKANKGWIDYVEFPEAYQEIFLRLADRAVPKKLKIEKLTNGKEDCLCPTCFKEFDVWNELGAFTNSYCGNCGQAIIVGVIKGGKHE